MNSLFGSYEIYHCYTLLEQFMLLVNLHLSAALV